MKISNLEDLEKFKNEFSNEFFELSIFENELNVRKEYLEFQKEKLEKEDREKLEKEKLDAEKKKMLEDKIEIAV
jgi:DNA repair ATPase RecN